MLSRKGTLSRKRASMRRHAHGARGGLAHGTTISTRRCSVPNLQPLALPVTSSLPCKSDTDLTGSGSSFSRSGTSVSPGQSRFASRRPSAGALFHNSSYGAIAGISGTRAGISATSKGIPGSAHSVTFASTGDFLCPKVNGTAKAGEGKTLNSSSCSSLRSYGGFPGVGGVPAVTVCDTSVGGFPHGVGPGVMLPDGKSSLLQGGQGAGYTRTQLSSLRGSVKVAGAVVGLGSGDGVEPTPPPSEKALYESTVVWADGDDPDQTFSVLGGLCEAGVETSNPCDFIARAFSILGATWPVTVFLVISLALPLVMTTIGVNYLHECPVEPKLPIYLVVGGCFGFVKLLFLLWKQIKRHKEDLGDLHDDIDLLTMTRMTNIALNIFLCVWFAFGHYWVFHIWKPQFEAPLHEPRNWCDETVFMFSFWQLIICHVVLAILVVLSAIMCCCFVCVKCVIADAKR